MADHHDHGPEGAHTSGPSLTCDETTIQKIWDKDIRRAARVAARGHDADANDYAQQARMRVMASNRSMPDAPAPYIRAVISNTIKTAKRGNAHRFSASSPMADPVDDNLPSPSSDSVEDRAAVVVVWTGTLPTPLQQVYRHLYVEGRSQRETAALMKMSQPRVAQLHRQLIERGRQQIPGLAA